MEDYCKYTDLKELYDKVIPPIQSFEESMDSLEKDMMTNKQIIMRFDEVLTQKASKISVQQIVYDLNGYVTREMMNKQNSIHEGQHGDLRKEIEHIDKKIQDLNEMAENEIKLAVKIIKKSWVTWWLVLSRNTKKHMWAIVGTLNPPASLHTKWDCGSTWIPCDWTTPGG